MRIQHNIMAMSAYRNYNNNTKALSGNLEKLSSGYKINRAGDDAAGLAISEKMRAQITGLDAAQKNVKDGISLVKTAEGAMQEIQDMLNRMDYLATQSANGTYDNEVDRLNLQKEVDQLKTEINRIADSANFNGIKLLDGSLEEGKEIVTPAAVETSFSATAATAGALLATTAAGTIGVNTILYDDTGAPVKTKMEINLEDIKWNGTSTADTMTITIGGAAITVTGTGATGAEKIADLISTAFGGSSTTLQVTAGVDFTATVSGNKLIIEMKDNPNELGSDGAPGGASADAMKPNWDVEISATGGVADAQWSAGSIEMVNGKQGFGEKLANTVVDMEKLGFNKTTAASNDGYTFVVDGTAYVLAVGNDSKWKGQTGLEMEDGTKVQVVEVSQTDTATEQLTKLANAVNKGSGLWEVGQNASGTKLTFKQLKKSDDDDVQAALQDATLEKFAGLFKGGSSTATEKAGETTKTAQGKALTLQIGDTSDPFNQMKVSVGDMHTKAMGTAGGQSIADIDIGNQEGAAKAIQVIKDAINYVSGVRGDLGAIQNRLEHTGNNLAVMAENIQDAESTIRDTDVANEMMSYVKNNILVQSAQAMLAQANQVPQGVLQLLG